MWQEEFARNKNSLTSKFVWYSWLKTKPERDTSAQGTGVRNQCSTRTVYENTFWVRSGVGSV